MSEVVFVARDEKLLRVAERLKERGISTEVVPSLSEGRRYSPKVVVVEVEEGGRLLRQVFDELKKAFPSATPVIVAKKAGVDDAVTAVKLGAYDFKLLSSDEEVLEEAVAGAFLEGLPKTGSGRFLTKDPNMLAMLEKLKPVAKTRVPVLIVGESGTGKEVLARWFHEVSDRARGPFVAVNCAALPEALLESELFGYEKGAFSGALTRKKGKFELADGGTILLDEITEMPLQLQAKLLRVLQEGEVDRLGGAYPVKVDVRVIATTNRNIEEEVLAGRFRQDLYFRLNVISVKIPPLRERKADIRFLAEHFLREFSSMYGKPLKGFAPGVLEALEDYEFPGNVRELRNMIERAVLLCEGDFVRLEDLSFFRPAKPSSPPSDIPVKPLEEVERELILKALSSCGGNRTQAAKLLGISVRTLRNKLKLYRARGLL